MYMTIGDPIGEPKGWDLKVVFFKNWATLSLLLLIFVFSVQLAPNKVVLKNC